MRSALLLTAALAALGGCQGRESAAPPSTTAPSGSVEALSKNDEARGGGGPRDMIVNRPATPAAAAPAKAEAAVDLKMRAHAAAADEEKPKGAPGDQSESPAAPTRSWFPETFLFEPLIVTDDHGAGVVRVRVPDRLTTWRVLALAHSRAGAQAGTVASFLGTLDTYVDAVLPPFLLVGDEVRLPVQVVNTTDAPVTAELRLSADNATVTPARAPVAVPAHGSLVSYATLKTVRPGPVALRAALGQTDAVVRTLPVRPAGRPMTTALGGTLGAPRSLALTIPDGADPAASEVAVVVYPGAVAVLRTELAGAPGRGGLADDAYLLGLAGRAPGLLAAFGDQADPAAVRQLSLIAAQRALRQARTLDVTSATLLAAAALAHPQNPVLARLAERAVAYLAQSQRPDGTFGGGSGWTLQRVLVATAEGTRAVQASAGLPGGKLRARAVALKAEGAVERNLERVDDGYTAAALLASGAVTGALAERLRERVRAGVKPRTDGSRALAVPEGVVRADGAVPSDVEATALAILALAGRADAPPADAELLADLGTTVLGAYRSPASWGDGRTNLVCLDAVLRLFATPVPPGVKVTLTVDDQVAAEGVLDQARLRDVLALNAPAPAAGSHTFKLLATPPVPGLAYTFTLTSYVPWTAPAGHGVELAVAPPTDLRVGRPATLVVRAAAPARNELRIRQGLPAGVQVDTASLDKLVQDGVLRSWHFSDGNVDLVAGLLEPGATFAAAFRVIPTLAGTLRAPASTLEVAGVDAYSLPPAAWTIR